MPTLAVKFCVRFPVAELLSSLQEARQSEEVAATGFSGRYQCSNQNQQDVELAHSISTAPAQGRSRRMQKHVLDAANGGSCVATQHTRQQDLIHECLAKKASRKEERLAANHSREEAKTKPRTPGTYNVASSSASKKERLAASHEEESAAMQSTPGKATFATWLPIASQNILNPCNFPAGCLANLYIPNSRNVFASMFYDKRCTHLPNLHPIVKHSSISKRV